VLSTWCLDASAYRPFDGTDADVAPPREWEFEMQTLGYYRVASSRFFDPGGVINYGLVPRVELVLQGFDFVPYDSPSGPNRLIDNGLFAKVVWRQGCLQDMDGPSFATEVGPLLPTINGPKGFGANVGTILSTCLGDALIAHWNGVAQLLPDTYNLDLFGGVILEPPPSKYTVRPVAEFFADYDFGGVKTYSGLVGAIWRVTERLSVDLAVRGAFVTGGNVTEVRGGFSLEVP
jgi:hypothetical protein